MQRRVIVMFGVLLASLTAARASEANGQKEARFGMAGLAQGDVARLNVVNLSSPRLLLPAVRVRRCEAVLMFLDGAGEPLHDDAGSIVMQKVALAPGESTHLDLPWRSTHTVGGTATMRSQVRALAIFTTRPGRGERVEPCGEVAATLEVYDEVSGRTSVLVNPGSLVGFNPQPEPPEPFFFVR